MSNKITKEQYDSLFSDDITKRQYDALIRLIDERVDYIVRHCIIEGRNFWYDYGNEGGEDHPGHFDPKRYKEDIGICGNDFDEDPHGIFHDGIPTRWLWEDFEPEVAAGLEARNEEIRIANIAAEEKKAAKKNKKAQLIESIRAKLTPEEFKLTKLK